MTARPIIFSGQMVRAILAGTKTQTRRIIKPPLKHPSWTGFSYFPESGIAIENGPDYPDDKSDERRCPYGVAGDELWVRETSAICSIEGLEVGIARKERMPPGKTLAETDAGLENIRVTPEQAVWAEKRIDVERWTPAIHMPRWMSRITLRVTAVRVERLHAISEADARAEGITDSWPEVVCNSDRPFRDGFRWLWDSLNAKRAPWAGNPWVWVITFERVKP